MILLLAAAATFAPQLSYASGPLVGAADLSAVSDKRFHVKEVARFWIDRPCEITGIEAAFAGNEGNTEFHVWRDIDHEWPFYRFERDLVKPFREAVSTNDLLKWRVIALGSRKLRIDNPGYVYVGVVVKPHSPTLAIDGVLDHPKFCRYEVFDTKTPRAAKAYWIRPGGDYAIKLTTETLPVEPKLFKDVTSTIGLRSARGSSVAWADIDGDGWEDLVLSGEQTQVFKNVEGKSFRDISSQCGLPPTSISIFADIDGDGDQDVFLGAENVDGADQIFVNDGKGHFKFSQSLKDGWPTKSATWLDYDLDGKVDLFVANGADGIKTHNCLWHNEGHGKFKLSPIKQIGNAPVSFSRSAVAADLDGDGRSEVAVGTLRLQPDQLWWIGRSSARDRAKAIHFDVARSRSGKLTGGQGAGVAIADLDGDARPDIWVANLVHPDWRGYEASVLSAFFMSHGSKLFKRKDADQMGLDFDESPADPTLADFDNDGDVDAYVGSTYHHGDYYENIGGRFRNTTYRSGIQVLRGESSAACDFDHDGRMDIVAVLDRGKRIKLYRNIASKRSWLEILLTGKQIVGASVYVRANGKRQLRQVICGKGLGSEDSRVLHFGLQHARAVDAIEIRWPGGRYLRLGRQAINQRLAIEQ